jgi:hypothetical protein
MSVKRKARVDVARAYDSDALVRPALVSAGVRLSFGAQAPIAGPFLDPLRRTCNNVVELNRFSVDA